MEREGWNRTTLSIEGINKPSKAHAGYFCILSLIKLNNFLSNK